MAILTQNFKERIEKEERSRIFNEFQVHMEREGTIPRTPMLMLRRFKKPLEVTIEVLIGALIGASSLILVFLIANKLLHL